MLKTDGRHLSDAQKLASLKPPMAGDDLRFSIDENRNIKAEGFDAAGDLLDLLLAVQPRVSWIGPKTPYRPVCNGEPVSFACTWTQGAL